MKVRKGQAAMEFLMTYGWAILAAVIVIAVLAYFGVFSPSTYVPDKCVLSVPLGCKDGVAGVSVASGLTFVIQNGAGSSVAISKINVTGCTVDTTGYNIADGSTQSITMACSGLSAGNKFKGSVAITYTKGTSTIAQESSGDIVAKITA
jgi:hypothetical protein